MLPSLWTQCSFLFYCFQNLIVVETAAGLSQWFDDSLADQRNPSQPMGMDTDAKEEVCLDLQDEAKTWRPPSCWVTNHTAAAQDVDIVLQLAQTLIHIIVHNMNISHWCIFPLLNYSPLKTFEILFSSDIISCTTLQKSNRIIIWVWWKWFDSRLKCLK